MPREPSISVLSRVPFVDGVNLTFSVDVVCILSFVENLFDVGALYSSLSVVEVQPGSFVGPAP